MAATATTWPHGLDPDLDGPDLAHLDGLPADELLAWAIGRFGDRFAVVTSFQAEGMVVLDLARRIDPGVRVLTLDTGRLPEETYQVIEAVRAGMGLEVEVVTPEDYLGDVIGDMNSRRGQIQGTDSRGNAQVVEAMVPLANMFGYVNQLRSFTQGRAQYTMQFSHYDEVPQNVADEVKAKLA